jgi:hemoglobin
MSRTMFERYGGFGTLSKVVLAFYERMIDSDVTGPYFDGVDMRRLIDHQTQFLSQVMGGPKAYTDDQLERYHAHLAIAPAAFDEAMELLRETLEDFSFDAPDVEVVLESMGGKRRCIVAPGSTGPGADPARGDSGGTRRAVP